MRRAALLFALALILATSTTSPAEAASRCRITGFTPRTVVVGLTPVTRTLQPRITGCKPWTWDITGGAYDFYAYPSARRVTFAPSSNAAARYTVKVTATDSRFAETHRTFPAGLRLLRNTGWTTETRVTPTRVVKGKPVTVTGRLMIANWSDGDYDMFGSRVVAVEFRPKGAKTWRAVRSTRTSAYHLIENVEGMPTQHGGIARTAVKATQDGYWRLRYPGSPISGPAVSRAVYVAVR